jgi:Raf kinase inhibitor-like YbhB/YbcL family protein
MRVSIFVLLSAISASALAQQGDGTNVTIVSHVFKPDKVTPTDDRIAGLRVAEGFKVNVFATAGGNPRIIAVASDSAVYVSRREQGDVLLYKDQNNDGVADGPAVTVLHRPGAHGLAVHDGKLYVATVHELFVADINSDDTVGELKLLVGDLPDAGQHADRTLAFGPDGMLYISTGSTCNACNEPNPENATILRANPDGTSRSIFASGLRNTIGFDWNPADGELWGLDNGIDFLGDDQQPEELNHIQLGKQYGWPHIYGKDGVNPQSTPVGGLTKDQWKSMSTPMELGYAAHAAPMQMLFYTATAFPQDYRGDAFATMRGSWNRAVASGYEIVRIHFERSKPRSIEPFVSGFLTDAGKTHFARPVGLAVAKDGSLLMADDGNGVIYRISYAGGLSGGDAESKAPAAAMNEQAMRGSGVPIAMLRDETQTHTSLSVQSTSFANGEAIPLRHSAYAENVSPPLSWQGVKGARSYVVLVEDPDAKPVTPFVHWVAYNVPASITSLPEGLETSPRLTDPDGLLQGRTSRGAPGYFGPKPPVGDPPHHYHFEVFALDTTLDLEPGSPRDDVLAAAKRHIIGKGELVGTFAQAVKPLK